MKNNKFLKVYAIIVVVLLILIFIAPNSFIERHSRFRKYYEMLDRMNSDDSSSSQTPTVVVVPYQEQLDSLAKNKYSYEYLLDHKGELYKCKGRIDGEYNQGRCTNPSEVEYTTETSKKVFKSLETKYLSIPEILELIKDVEYKEVKLGERTNYVYEIDEGKVTTEITIQSDQSQIVEILINKIYLVYEIKISNIEN